MDKWRTPEAAEYRKLYKGKAWTTLRKRVLLRDGFKCQHKGCGVSVTKGRSSPRSAVVHHLKPHKGDLDLFYNIDNLQLVCWSCHSGDIQSAEARGFDTEIGEDGWPLDEGHPAHR